MAHALIDLRHVTHVVEGRTLIDNVSLAADEKRIAIVGRNGSGKTTLARIMAGLIKPQQGEVTIDGAAVARDRKAALRRVGILFQNPDHQIIFPTVEEELAFGLRQQGKTADETARAVTDILNRFERAHWAKAAVHQLSQGQRQLVCLMAILLMAPKVILLDEPFSGLDIPTAARLRRFLDQLDVTLVQITHDPAAVADYDRALWIDEGRVMRDGPAREVLPDFIRQMQQIGLSDDLSHIAS